MQVLCSTAALGGVAKSPNIEANSNSRDKAPDSIRHAKTCTAEGGGATIHQELQWFYKLLNSSLF
jgi:hypothetical protein